MKVFKGLGSELLTTAEMTAADAFAVSSGIPSLTLMENAGRAVADAITARYKPCPVTILCGPGNNGGDGFVVARLLYEDGFSVRVAHDGVLKGDADIMAAKWSGETEALTPDALRGAKLVVDGLFGAGLSRPLEGAAAQIVEALNDLPVVAIDIPSGVSGDTGQPLGAVYVTAALTVTFFRKKPGHLLLPGRALCGELVLADIGIPAEAADTQLHENTPTLWRYPHPRAEGHKYDRGHCVVVCGPAHATGAARLAARGALRVGAGLVSVASSPEAVAVNAAHLTAIMLKPFDGADGLAQLLADKRLNAVVIGPGLGVGGETRELVIAVLKSGASVVLDADALTSFHDDPDALFARLHDRCVLTPHAGEFERLFPGLLDEAAGKVDAVRTAAARAGCTVLLKGGDTVIAHPSGKAAINANAPPTLATAGAGDVLAGFIAGLLAQKLTAFDAACCGVWLHGATATLFGPGLIAEDLPEMLPAILADLP
ncbi:MAG: carbohydrate kinase, YjeF related protein [Alphaproteobacteria bacterium]|nr:carbohydrate kinase, YjeF related protein [Alphaproteobacteria bacterium]